MEPTISFDDTMIALYPPRRVRQRLAVSRGLKPEDLHVTLLYMGRNVYERYGIDADYLKQIVGRFANRWPAIRLNHTGYGVFKNSYNNVSWAGVNGDHLHDLREDLTTYMLGYGIGNASEFNGFIPHMTLRYNRKPFGRVARRKVVKEPWTQSRLSLVIGNERTDFKLRESESDYFRL